MAGRDTERQRAGRTEREQRGRHTRQTQQASRQADRHDIAYIDVVVQQ